jgi:hypothetical protein
MLESGCQFGSKRPASYPCRSPEFFGERYVKVREAQVLYVGERFSLPSASIDRGAKRVVGGWWRRAG